MCILFGYHAQIILSFFRLKLIDTMYLVYATPPTVYSDSFETLQVFRAWSEDAHILFGYNPQIIFCYFFY